MYLPGECYTTPSEEKQKDEVLNNQVVDFHSYSAKEKKDNLNIENNKRKCSSDEECLQKESVKLHQPLGQF